MRRRRFRSTTLTLALVSALAFAAVPARATTMQKRLTLAEVTNEATRIIHGTVTVSTSGRDQSGAPATWTTIAVARTVKGTVGATLTIKQFGVAGPLPDGAITRFPGMPRYAVGEEVVLFLRADSRRGFTSPIGLEQGVYRVQSGMARSALGKDAEPVAKLLAEIARLDGWKK